MKHDGYELFIEEQRIDSTYGSKPLWVTCIKLWELLWT